MSLTRLASVGLFQKIHTDDGDVVREVRLHRAVLDKALVDLFSDEPDIKQDVDDWLFMENPDFIACCERAGLDPELVYFVFKHMPKILVGDKAKFKTFGKTKKDTLDEK